MAPHEPAQQQEANETHAHQEEEAPDASPPPSAAPETTPETTAAPHRFTVTQFRHAVKVANVLAQTVEDQKEVLRKKDFHLLLLTEQVKESQRNPCGCPGPTPAQQKEAREKEMARQERLAREHEKLAEKLEREAERRKVANEHMHDVHLAIQKLESWDASRRADAKRRRPVSEQEKKAKRELFARAHAIAEAKGRPMYVSDLRAAAMKMK